VYVKVELPDATIVEAALETVIVTGVAVVAELYVLSAAIVAVIEHVPLDAVIDTTPELEFTEQAVELPAL
jgi:hypothetical protein